MPNSIYDIAVTTADGKETTLTDYQGKALLIVNVASKCGFTKQYEGLEALHQTYKDRGLCVLGIPSNDFGGQEPGTIDEIKQFCSTNYGVTFDLLDKVHAKGDDQHPLYQWLTTHADPQGEVQWNFEKFLVSGDGAIRGRFVSKVEPDSPELIQAIDEAI